MSIHIILGKPRQGKTTFANILAREFVSLGHKRPVSQRRKVYANFPIYHEEIGFFSSYQELQSLSNCVAFVDECSGWFGKRSYAKTSDDDLMYWRQHGHDDATLYVLAHSLNDIETKIAELATTIWYVKRLFGPALDEGPTRLEQLPFVGWRVKATNFEAHNFLAATKRVRNRSIHFRIDKHYNEYDSFYVVGNREGKGSRSGRGPSPQEKGRAAHALISEEVYSASRFTEGWGSRVIIRPSPAALNGTKA